ncbi:MAG: hypothetical protein K6T80_04635 [Firmicutes bacterium]|nr:hypothetical protein [Bacillota bacterium]
MKIEDVKKNLNWDFDVNKESLSLKRDAFFAFVIDVWEGRPQLVLYTVKRNGSTTDELEINPPREMLVKAVEEQGGSLKRSCLYNINAEIRGWIEKNLLS